MAITSTGSTVIQREAGTGAVVSSASASAIGAASAFAEFAGKVPVSWLSSVSSSLRAL
eukprot:CAMPEP_0202826282 /NCGR_PEP_ID=MMETSP1389-20130828/13511_1 /ASSEMBLY_ACC=CAM_ASM_000865 /TAXON_ID=302021 /ORGANISM="Rhodomonas sp., Strain CCMP768" /LENGTH=57 /DNA_ID=CAMNT_0049499563 /DNA_START=80 /DNA_END=250 /DNA_ORIENTATION=+